MSDGNFVSDIIKEQETTRNDIRSLKEIIERLCIEVAGNSESLRRIVGFQAAQDEREARQVSIAEDVTKIANAVVGLVEDMHSQNRILTGLLEKLDKRLSAESTLDYVLARMEKEE